jgi:hypothetical protein
MLPFGNVPPEMPRQPVTMDKVPQAITAAMLMAAKSGCGCEVCSILRTAIDEMAAPFLPQKSQEKI